MHQALTQSELPQVDLQALEHALRLRQGTVAIALVRVRILPRAFVFLRPPLGRRIARVQNVELLAAHDHVPLARGEQSGEKPHRRRERRALLRACEGKERHERGWGALTRRRP